MDRRRAAGLLLALAACFAVATAAPTASNHTALDLYDGAPDGCYYNFQHYGEGDRIMTNEPCLNCTCHNRMLMCYLRVCPFTKPIGQDCTIEKRADQCCPIVTCPDVPVDLLTSTTTSPAEYGATGVGKLDSYGCSIDGKYFSEGSKVPPAPNKPCEHCYCIRNMTTCVMQECTLHVDGCTPIYHKDVCCPVRYSCDHPEDEQPLLDDMSTTVRPTPGFLLTTTTLSPVTQMSQDCVYDNRIFPDGALIKTEKACDHCYCMKGDIVCVVQECGTPMENEGKNCTAMPPREGVCCPDTYICEGDEQTTGTYEDNEITTEMPQDSFLTLSPPRRNGSEGSGYRNEDKAPFTETPLPEPEVEGSGEEVTESVNQFGSTDETEEPHEFISVTPETKKPDLTTTTQRSEIISTTEMVQEPEFGSGEEEKIVDDIPKESSTFEQPESTTLYDNFVEKTETTSIEPESHVKEPVTPDSATEEDNKPSDEQEYTTGKLPLATVPDADENVEPAVVSTTALPISEEIEKKTTTALPISEEIERITTTALPISEEIETKTTTALPLSEEIEKKTTTALPLSEEIEKKTTTALPISEEIEKKTTTALPIAEEIEKKTTTALPISEEIERKTTESDVNIMSTSADVEKESLQPEYHASTTIASINDEEVSTDSPDSITESVEGTDFAPQHQNVVTSSTPLLEEIEKETTELSEKKTTSFEDFNLSTTSTSRLPDENVDKQVETEIPEEFSTEHIPISGLETDLLPTVSPDNKVDDEDHVTDYEQYATTVKSPITDDKERRTTLSESTTNVPEHVDSDILRTTLSEESSISFTTAEPDKGLNTIPSGSLDEESSESSVTEKLHETAQTLTTLEPLITEKVYDHDVAETTPKSQQEITDDNTELSSDRPPQSPDQEKETTSDFTDKATTLAPSHGDIDSTTSIDKDMVTSEVPKSTEIIKETTETFDATTEISYMSTKEPEKEVTSEMAETTTVNLEENEILNESRIPGEGDCLVNGITYRNESTVPSSNKCETGCKCVSSILKCDPIICSAPPEYMDNCRTMYDSIDSCCPTYICDQKSETMPPQSHSQMSGTESPAISPVQCHGDECEIIEHKKETIQPCTSESCTNKDEGTQIIDSKPIVEPQDQAGVACNDENGCQGTPVKSCEGDACKSPEIISPEQDLPCHGNDCNIPIKPVEDNKESCHDKESCKPPLDAIEQECIGETCRRKEPSIPDQQTPECLGDNCDSRIPTIPETEQTTELASDITTAKISTDEFVTKTPLPEISSPSKSESEHDITTALPQESELLLTTNAPEIETSSTPSHVEKEDEMPHEESSTESKIPEPFEEQTISDENVTKMIEESTDIPKLSSFIPDIESDGVTKIFEEVTETSETSDTPKPIIENEQTPPQVSEYSTKVYETEMDSSTRKEDAMTEVSSETDKDSEIITISPVTDKILTEIPESMETYVGHDESSVTDGTPEVTSKKTHDVEHESTPIVDLEITTKPTKIYDAGTYESTIPTDLDDSKKVTPIEDSEDLRTTEAIEENLPTKKPEIGLPEASTDKTETDLDDESDIKLTTPEQSSHDQTLDLDTTKLPVSDTEETLTITTVTPEKDLIDDVTTKTSETTLKPLETTEKEMITDSTQKQIEDVTKAASDITTETSILDDEKVQDETKEDVDLRLTTLSFEYTKAQTESSDEIVKTTVTPIISDDVSNQQPTEEMTDTSVYNTETSVLEDNESSVTKLENVPESTEMAIEKETTVSFDHNDELTTKTVVEVSTQPTLDAGAEESHEHEPEQNLEMVTSADHMVTESEVKPESSTTSAVEVSPTVSEEENISEPSKTQEQEQDQETSTKGSEITDSVQPQTPVEENVLEPTKEHKDEPGTLIEESEVTDKSPPAIEVDQSTEPIKTEIETKPDISEVIESVTKQSVEVETDSPKPSDIVPETDEKEELSTTASDEITAVTSDFRRTTPLEVHEYITTKPEVLVTESGEIGVTTKVNAIDETETKTTMEPIVEQSTKHDYEPEKDSHTPSEQVESESVPTKSYETEPEKGTTTAYETSTEIPLKIEQGEPEQPNTDATPSELPSSPKDAMITTESSVGYTSSIHTIDLGEATTLANDISELSTISEPSGTESPKIEPEIIVTESQEMQEISTKTPEKEVEIPLQATDMQPDISTSEKEEFVTEKSDLDKPDVTEKNIQEEGDKDITTKIPGLDTEVTYERTREPEETSTDKITTDSSDSEVMKSTTPIIEEFVTDEPQKVDKDIREPEPELQPAEGTSSPVTEEIIETSTKIPESGPTENIEPSSEKPFITENLTEKPIQLTEPSVLQHEVTSESSDTTSHEEILEKETIQPSLETSTSKIYEHSAYPDEDHDVTNAPSTQAEEMSSTSQPIIDSHKLSPGAVEETFDEMSDSKTTTASPYIQTEKIEEVDHEVTHQDEHITQAPDVKIPELTTVEDTVQSEITESSIISTTDIQKVAEETVTDAPGPITTSLPNVPETSTLSSEHTSPQQQDEIGTTQEQESEQTKPSDLESSEKPLVEMPTSEEEPSSVPDVTSHTEADSLDIETSTISRTEYQTSSPDIAAQTQAHDATRTTLADEVSPQEPSIVTDKTIVQEEPVAPEVTEQAPIITKEPSPSEASLPEDEILTTPKATTSRVEEEETTTPSTAKPVDRTTKPTDAPATEQPKPIPSDSVEDLPPPDEEAPFPPTGSSGYGQEPDYMEEDQTFGPGTCRYGGKVYVSAQQIPRDDPCDFCFCFRSDIICLQQSCPPPIHGCHEEPIQGFCCPRYECPVSMATTVNVTTTTTTTTTTLPPHFPIHSYKGSAQRKGCLIKGQSYKVGDVVRSSSGPCLHCTCGGDGQMKCDPKACTPEPMLRQMIAAAVSSKRRR